MLFIVAAGAALGALTYIGTVAWLRAAAADDDATPTATTLSHAAAAAAAGALAALSVRVARNRRALRGGLASPVAAASSSLSRLTYYLLSGRAPRDVLASTSAALYDDATLVRRALPAALLALHCAGLFSNSYIEADALVVRYLVTTLGVALALIHVRHRRRRAAVAALAGALCAAAAARLCVAVKHDASLAERGLLSALVQTYAPHALLVAELTRAVGGDARRHALSFAAHATLALYWTLVGAGALDGDAAYWSRVGLPHCVTAASAAHVWLLGGARARRRLFWSALPPLMLLVGPAAPLALLLLYAQLRLLLYAVEEEAKSAPDDYGAGDDDDEGEHDDDERQQQQQRQQMQERRHDEQQELDFLMPATIVYFTSIQYFFATGHAYAFSALQWGAAFVGFDEMHWATGVLGVLLNTTASHVAAICVAFDWLRGRDARLLALLIVALFALQATLTSTFVYTARHHLMVWRVFAPKFVFDVGLLVLIDVYCLLLMGGEATNRRKLE